jgi:hypothetical protein
MSSHRWDLSASPDAFYQTLVEAVRNAGRDLGVGLNDPTNSVEDLVESRVVVDEDGHHVILRGER